MSKRIVLGVAVIALAVLVMAPAASASCNPAKNASTYANGATAYWHTSIPSGTLVGQTWQLGAPGTFIGNGGAVPCADFLYFSAGGLNLNLNLGGCGAGCPATGSTLAVLAQISVPTATEFLLATVTETLAGDTFFDYAAQGDHNMVPLPRPRVMASSRTGSAVNLTVQVPAVTPGLYGPNAASAITGFNILSASSAADPGRNASAYDAAPLVTIPSAGGGPASGAVTVDCSNQAQDRWVVTQIQFEGGGVVGSAVSDATRVNCNPALADPKYKIIPKKGSPKQHN